jgi:hypothetical protein
MLSTRRCSPRSVTTLRPADKHLAERARRAHNRLARDNLRGASMTEREVGEQASSRIALAQETRAALTTLMENPTREKLAAFHELHAHHLREQGKYEAAARADERARAVRRRRSEPAWWHQPRR